MRLVEAERARERDGERERQWEGNDWRELKEESTHAGRMGGTHGCCLHTHTGAGDF